MSQENVELVRRFLEHWNETGDFPWDLVDPDIVYVIDPPAWLAGTYRGHAEVRDVIRRTWEVYDEFRVEVEELIDAGDAVVALGAAHVRGALSGATAVQLGFTIVAPVRDGRIVAFRVYYDRAEALEAAGYRSGRCRRRAWRAFLAAFEAFAGSSLRLCRELVSQAR
jgi:ketosteroid isomerase-like protein